MIACSADICHKSNKSIKKLHNWQNCTLSVVKFRESQREGMYRLHRDTDPSMNLGFLLLAFISQENDWHFLPCVLIFSACAVFSDLCFSLQRKAVMFIFARDSFILGTASEITLDEGRQEALENIYQVIKWVCVSYFLTIYCLGICHWHTSQCCQSSTTLFLFTSSVSLFKYFIQLCQCKILEFSSS